MTTDDVKSYLSMDEVVELSENQMQDITGDLYTNYLNYGSFHDY